MNLPLRPSWCMFSCVLLLVHEVHAGPVRNVSVVVSWDSRYVSEGRDNLAGVGLISGSVNVEWLEFGFGGWYARGTDGGYSEANFAVNRGYQLGPVELGVSYTRIEFPGMTEGSGDNEFGAYGGTGLFAGLRMEAGARYSTEADGAFVEVVLRRPWAAGRDGLLVVPYAMQAFDLGYASVLFDGPNHFELGVTLQVPVTDQISLTAHISHAFAQRDVKDDGRDDVTWGGMGVAVAF